MDSLDELLADLHSATNTMKTEQGLYGGGGGAGSTRSSSSSGSLPSQVYQARLSPHSIGRPVSSGSDQNSSGLLPRLAYSYEPKQQALQSQQHRYGGSGDRIGGGSGDHLGGSGALSHQFKRDSDRYSSGSTGSGDYPPPPLPPPPSKDVIEEATTGYTSEPLYEMQNIVKSAPLSSGGVGYASTPSTLGANLNELDYLLQDLNSAQFMEEISRSGSDNSLLSSQSRNTRPPPATLPKPLSRSSPRSPGVAAAAASTSVPAFGSNAAESLGSASVLGHTSSATRELEDLMDSLSEFKLVTNTALAASHADEPSYAKVDKTPSNPTTPTSISVGGPIDCSAGSTPHSPAKAPAKSDLENMLGNLESDMRGHGVSVSTKGLCGACAKPIVGQVITALGRIWHPEHFCCHSCDEELGTRSFFERDEMPYCEECYHRLFAPLCGKCKAAILDKCVTAMDSTWHMECFVCEHCGRMLNDEGFHERDGRPYCRNDYFEIFAPKCGGCNLPITEDFISTLNTHWHPHCFRCMVCGLMLAGGSFYDHDGLPYCETHYYAKRGSLCAGCQKPITGRCITAMSRKFHPEHFTCAFCLKQLNKGTFKEQNDKAYCHPCFVKLFG